MHPRVRLATVETPGGGEMELYRHDRDYSILVDGQDLMHSRQHASELALARLGCAHLVGRKAVSILIGGLGMGYTLRQALDMLDASASVVVGEFLAAIVEWNRAFFGALNGRPLEDQRVDLRTGDVVALVMGAAKRFDAILLDIDNGPSALTDPRNNRLYSHEGIRACRRALRAKGCLAVWSAAPSKAYEQRLMAGGFHVRRFRVPAYPGSKSLSRFVWVAAEDKRILPPGGGEPRRPPADQPNPRSGRARTRARR